MKTSTILLGASAAFAAAQADFPAGFPQCGIICITNMLAKSSSEFNCQAQDIQCLCSNANFLFGVRDCADQACTDAAQADSVKQVGISYCANVGIAVSGIPYTGAISATASATTTIYATDAPTSAAATASSTDGGDSGDNASSVAVSTVFSETTDSAGSVTSVPVSTIFSDATGAGESLSTIAVSTVFSESTDSAGSVTSVPVSTVFSTATLSESTITGTTTGTATNTVSNDSTTLTATETSTGTTLTTSTGTSRPSGSSSSSSAFAAQQTVGPAGLIAAAGMGIVLML